MALKFKPGDKVRQLVKPIEGEVVDAAIVDADVHFRVRWMNEDGEVHERTFTEEQIETVHLSDETPASA